METMNKALLAIAAEKAATPDAIAALRALAEMEGDMLAMAQHVNASSPQHKERRLREWAGQLRALLDSDAFRAMGRELAESRAAAKELVASLRAKAEVGHAVESRGMTFAADPRWFDSYADRIDRILSERDASGAREGES
ncbi:hypothetical protein ACFQZQ_03175 [Lysobacter koreensis]|uniref:Uncharacterized protein n=1 Tax=Lysobacter koreensis TaxID=266122 RepID=A0ABW2YJB3_9GAMM